MARGKKKAAPLDNTDEGQAKKIAESKKNSRAADKKKAKEELKRTSNKLLMDMAAKLPAGPGKKFINDNIILDDLEAQRRKISQAISAKRKEMKSDKIDLKAMDVVRKLRDMEPEDRAAHKTTVSLYEQQLDLPLSEEQQTLINAMRKRQDDTKASIIASHGGDAGEEVGSGNGSRIPERNEEVGDVPPVAAEAAAGENVVRH